MVRQPYRIHLNFWPMLSRRSLFKTLVSPTIYPRHEVIKLTQGFLDVSKLHNMVRKDILAAWTEQSDGTYGNVEHLPIL